MRRRKPSPALPAIHDADAVRRIARRRDAHGTPAPAPVRCASAACPARCLRTAASDATGRRGPAICREIASLAMAIFMGMREVLSANGWGRVASDRCLPDSSRNDARTLKAGLAGGSAKATQARMIRHRAGHAVTMPLPLAQHLLSTDPAGIRPGSRRCCSGQTPGRGGRGASSLGQPALRSTTQDGRYRDHQRRTSAPSATRYTSPRPSTGNHQRLLPACDPAGHRRRHRTCRRCCSAA